MEQLDFFVKILAIILAMELEKLDEFLDKINKSYQYLITNVLYTAFFQVTHFKITERSQKSRRNSKEKH